MSEMYTPNKAPVGVRILFFVLSIGYLATMPLWFIYLASSVKLIGSPNQTVQAVSIAFFYAWMVYPVVLIAGSVAGWMFYAKRQLKLATLIMLMPLLWVALSFFGMVVGLNQ